MNTYLIKYLTWVIWGIFPLFCYFYRCFRQNYYWSNLWTVIL